MNKLKHIYLVRHGESTANELDIREDVTATLTSSGQQQSVTVAERFKDIPIEVVLSSTYKRTKETGQQIAKISGVPFEVFEGVHEREYPESIIGKHRNDPVVKEALAKFEYGWVHGAKLDDGEHFEEMRSRVATVSKKLEEREEEHIAITTHGFFMVFFAAFHILGDYFTPDLFINEFLRSFHISNTGITHFVITQDKRWVLASWNDSSHLGPLKK